MKKIMNIWYISDLHLDFWMTGDGSVNPNNPKFTKIMKKFVDSLMPEANVTEDTCVIAGDLSHYNQQSIGFLEELGNRFKNVLFVVGNHDMYLVSNKQVHKYKDSVSRVQELHEHFKESMNIHPLNGNIVEIDGVIFAGTQMTWDFNDALGISEALSDGKYIKGISHDEILLCEVAKLKAIEGSKINVMVTHMPPVPSSFNDMYSVLYTFNAQKYDIVPDVWIYGHTHENTTTDLAGIKFCVNAYGYPTNTKNTTKFKLYEHKEHH